MFALLKRSSVRQKGLVHIFSLLVLILLVVGIVVSTSAIKKVQDLRSRAIGPCDSVPTGVNQLTSCIWDGTQFNTFIGAGPLGELATDPAPLDFVALNNNWGAGSPNPVAGNDTFSIRWSGSFTFMPGVYKFRVYSDDGVRLKLNGVTLIDQMWDGEHGRDPELTYSYRFNQQATATIELDYYENTENAIIVFGWNYQPLPPGNLAPQAMMFDTNITQVTLSWDPVPGAQSYIVEGDDLNNIRNRSPVNNCQIHYICVQDHPTTSITVPVQVGHAYHWWVKAKHDTHKSERNEASFAVKREPSTSTLKLVGPVVFHWYGPKGPNPGQWQSPWLPLEGRDKWDGGVAFWTKQTEDIIAATFNFIFFNDSSLIEFYDAQRNHLLALKQLKDSGKAIPKIAPFFAPESWKGRSGDLHLRNPQLLDLMYQEIHAWFQLYFSILSKDDLAQVNGKVIIGLWFIESCGDPQYYNQANILRDISTKLQSDFSSFGMPAVYWSTVDCWYFTTPAPDEFHFLFSGIPQFELGNNRNVDIGPGFWKPNDTYVSNGFVPRLGGQTYRDVWTKVLAYKEQFDRVYIESWNEYTEGSGIYEAKPTTHTVSGDSHSINVNINACWDNPCHPILYDDFWGDDPRTYIKISAENIAKFLNLATPTPTPRPPTPTPSPTPSPSPTPTASATFSLVPSSQSLDLLKTPTFVVQIREVSGTHPVQSVQSDLSYDATRLYVKSIQYIGSSFPLQTEEVNIPGTLQIGRSTPSSATGDALVAIVTFGVKVGIPANTRLAVSFASSSSITSALTNTNILTATQSGVYTITEKTNIIQLSMFLTNFNTTNPRSDIAPIPIPNGTVDVVDLSRFITNYDL